MKLHQAEHLLIICLNNFHAIEAAYGADAAQAAVDHLCDIARHHLGRIGVRSTDGSRIMLTTHYPLMQSLPAEQLVETLCDALGSEPFRYKGHDILLSISAGQASIGQTLGRAQETEAIARLAASTLRQSQIVVRRGEGVALYQKDMKQAAQLLRWIGDGEAAISWRPVCRPCDGNAILYYESMLRRVGENGEQMDCAANYAALERLGLAHLLDRLLVRDVIRELKADPAARLSVAVSSQSLSMNLYGEGAGWTDVIDRLKREPSLARRLVIEIGDNSGIACFRDALAFVRTLRSLGVRISVARFGSGHASIGELMTLSPDVVKLDSPFMRTAYQSERNRMRVGHLLGLARSMSSTVIVDGVETPWHLHLAAEEGAEWVAGSHLGRPSVRRGWIYAGHGERSPARRAPQGHLCVHAKASDDVHGFAHLPPQPRAISTISDSVS
jgi:EAL domain-containing protein (putative c-di-GMP-specific phosphodiesterase class I)